MVKIDVLKFTLEQKKESKDSNTNESILLEGKLGVGDGE